MFYTLARSIALLSTLFILTSLCHASVIDLLGASNEDNQQDAESTSAYAASPNKVAVAHFMVGNTYPYSPNEWRQDLLLAASKGISAFALNLGRDDWQPQRIADAFDVADKLGGKVKLFFSFDMTSIPCSERGHAHLLKNYINAYSSRKSYLYYADKPLVSTFAGEYCTFGRSQWIDDAWSWMKSELPPNTFVPAFFIPPTDIPRYQVFDGLFNWDSSWPINGGSINFNSDYEYISRLGGRIYMAACSPWFFTHYGANSYNKNWIYRSDDWLLASRWEILINNRNSVDIVQIISWNDYGESHYVGPIKGAQPNSQAWVDGYSHTAWLDLISYFVPRFTLARNLPILTNRALLWGRLAPWEAQTNDSVPRPSGASAENTANAIWGVVTLCESATVTLSCGTTSRTFSLGPGLSKITIPLYYENCSARVTTTFSDGTTVDRYLDGYRYTTSPATYNFNAFVSYVTFDRSCYY